MKVGHHLTYLDSLKQRLDARQPLPAATERPLHNDILLQWTYHSNAIEGNALTLEETQAVFAGHTVGGKSLHDVAVHKVLKLVRVVLKFGSHSVEKKVRIVF